MNNVNKYLRHLRIIYAVFIGLLLLCIGLFLTEVISSDDYYTFDRVNERLLGDKTNASFVMVTDIRNKANSTAHDFVIDNPADTTLAISAHVNRIDVSVLSTDESRLSSPLATTAIVLQFATVLILLVIFIFIFLELRSLYKSFKQGKIFQKKSIRYLKVIAIALILMSLCIDFAKYCELQYIKPFLESTDIVANTGFTLHFVRLMFGLVILFIAEIFHIGIQMQEDQDLTI
jgi:hypothetical protein